MLNKNCLPGSGASTGCVLVSEKIYRKYEGHPGKRPFPSRTLIFFGRWFLRLFYKIRVEGLEHVPVDGPLLVLPKHQRHEDIPLGYANVLARRRKDIWCIMKTELAKPLGGFFLKCGGLPVDRQNPEKSKRDLLLGRRVLHDGNVLVLFPEQTFYKERMGRGRTPGFRFITGKPAEAIQVLPLGFEYRKRRFRRTELIMRAGPVRLYSKREDPEEFLHDCMLEIARLSQLEYPFEKPAGRKAKQPTGR